MLIEHFDLMGIRSNYLSDLVSKLSLIQAAEITAAGIKAQFKYLNTVGYIPCHQIYTKLLIKALKPGKIVVVKESRNWGFGSNNTVIGFLEEFDNAEKIVRIACTPDGIREFSLNQIVRVCDIEDGIHPFVSLEGEASFYERLITMGLEPGHLHGMVVKTVIDKAIEINEKGLNSQVDFLRVTFSMNDINLLLEALNVAKGEGIDVEVVADQPVIGRLHNVNFREKSISIQLPDKSYSDLSIYNFVRIVR